MGELYGVWIMSQWNCWGKKSHEAHSKYLTESSLTHLLPCHQAYQSGSSAITRGGKNQDSDEHEHSWRNANSKYSWLARCFEVRKWGWRSPVPGRNSSWRCVRSPPAGAPTGCLHSDPQDCKTLTYKGDFWKGGNTQSSLGCRLGNAECSDAT